MKIEMERADKNKRNQRMMKYYQQKEKWRGKRGKKNEER